MGFMERFRLVPVPARMALLDRDSRGFPIPYIVLRSPNGTTKPTPHFVINDQSKVDNAKRKQLCGICGKPFESLYDSRGRVNPHPENTGMWFVGGPLSALHPNGAYIDPPSHRECAHYALQVCPYLAAPSYATRTDDRVPRYVERVEEEFRKDGKDAVTIITDPTMIPDRPREFVAVWATTYTLTPGAEYMRPLGVRQMHVWRHGARLPPEDSQYILQAWIDAIQDGRLDRDNVPEKGE